MDLVSVTRIIALVTPTLKVRRKVVVEKYGRLLDALYGKD